MYRTPERAKYKYAWICSEIADDTSLSRVRFSRSLLVAVQIRESTTEPFNFADIPATVCVCVYTLTKPGTNYLAKSAVPALSFKQHSPMNSEVYHVEHRLELAHILKQIRHTWSHLEHVFQLHWHIKFIDPDS